jgi:hypothetical protein
MERELNFFWPYNHGKTAQTSQPVGGWFLAIFLSAIPTKMVWMLCLWMRDYCCGELN